MVVGELYTYLSNGETSLERVKQIKDIDAFFKALATCQGRVELITDDKDVLNLASKLSCLSVLHSFGKGLRKRLSNEL